MIRRCNYRISTKAEELTEGLFGQVFLFVFEILPALHRKRIFPAWAIRSLKYGVEPDFVVIPGLLDVNYDLPKAPYVEYDLREMRARYCKVLGGDWKYASRLWNTYFRVPERVVLRAAQFGSLGSALGLHYRGTDKNQDAEQTNPVSRDDFLAYSGFHRESPGN